MFCVKRGVVEGRNKYVLDISKGALHNVSLISTHLFSTALILNGKAKKRSIILEKVRELERVRELENEKKANLILEKVKELGDEKKLKEMWEKAKERNDEKKIDEEKIEEISEKAQKLVDDMNLWKTNWDSKKIQEQKDSINKIIQEIRRAAIEAEDRTTPVDSEEDKTYWYKCYSQITKLHRDQIDIRKEVLATVIEKKYKWLSPEEMQELSEKYDSKLEEIRHKSKIKNVQLDIESEYGGDATPISYYQGKLNIVAKDFKDIMQYEQKRLAELHQILSKKPGYSEDLIKEDKEFSENLIKKIRGCREEKKNIGTFITSRLESPAELAESLVDEMGPDYTGGDD